MGKKDLVEDFFQTRENNFRKFLDAGKKTLERVSDDAEACYVFEVFRGQYFDDEELMKNYPGYSFELRIIARAVYKNGNELSPIQEINETYQITMRKK